MLTAAIVLIAGGLVVSWLGQKAAVGNLDRNWVVGIRIPSTLASDEAWDAGHRAAGRILILAGSAPIIGGALMLVVGWGRDTLAATIALVACGVLVGLVLISGRVADRAAKAVTVS
ncbi:MAG: SdpI family protein [Acidimicrobiia bacterium]|nr:SdpI family protein [Acidimicrobiia bacterium]